MAQKSRRVSLLWDLFAQILLDSSFLVTQQKKFIWQWHLHLSHPLNSLVLVDSFVPVYTLMRTRFSKMGFTLTRIYVHSNRRSLYPSPIFPHVLCCKQSSAREEAHAFFLTYLKK